MINILLWDVDGTLLNFLAAESAAVKECFALFGLGECTDEMVRRYSAINGRYWHRLELGEIAKPRLLTERFKEFFAGEGIAFAGVEAFNAEYQLRLGNTIGYNDDSLALVRKLKGRTRQYAVTNGTTTAQSRKLAASGLGELLDGVFISDEVGFEKPSPVFFDRVFAEIGGGRREAMIVGDSLTSDMRGGNNAGILCCWYNPQGVSNDAGVRIDYEIKNLWEVEGLLV